MQLKSIYKKFKTWQAKKRYSNTYLSFTIFNYIILVLIALTCVLPLVNVLAVSLSEKSAVEAGLVGFFPIRLTFDSYGYVFSTPAFFNALWISVKRTVLGTAISLVLTTLLAYAMSRPTTQFRGRGVYMTIIVISMLFSGGLVPTYIVVANGLGLKDTIWALVLPGAVHIYSAIIMMNFFRQLPRDIEEAAYIDGADHFQTLVKIILPCSLPIIATVVLFVFINQWNSWFDGLIYNSQPENYPLQTYLQQFMAEPPKINLDSMFVEISNNSLASANIFIIMLPIIIIYPALQKYFIKGMVLGSVKG